jgi:hypothetical protein
LLSIDIPQITKNDVKAFAYTNHNKSDCLIDNVRIIVKEQPQKYVQAPSFQAFNQ